MTSIELTARPPQRPGQSRKASRQPDRTAEIRVTTCCQAPLAGIRCTGCGHRQTLSGVMPAPTRSQPPWTWPGELAGRWLARRLGR